LSKISPKWILLRSLLFLFILSFCIIFSLDCIKYLEIGIPNCYFVDLSNWVAPKFGFLHQ
jgi:hypothetical protein